ncbi:glucose-1-phosphate cytidylyltransferase [Alphaproteobacteria bacterium]|nr:glucose-1-phosphate cytidylyltransferase [Alphaproteobacteria bacterium]
MKVVILAGGFGSRLAEETSIKPKPMVEIGGIPILEHIMNWYMSFGYYEFIICLGYKGSEIISYFKEYNQLNSTCIVNENGKLETINNNLKPWKITLAQTGINTQTAGRIKKINKFLNKDEDFLMTYGDGLSDVNINNLTLFHRNNKKLVTVTAVRPLARFGAMEIKNGTVKNFIEKPKTESGWVNGGFFVVSPKVMSFINSCFETWEKGPLTKLANNGNLAAYKHEGFWQPMDTLREKQILCNLWEKGKAPWKINNYKIKNIHHLSKNVRRA